MAVYTPEYQPNGNEVAVLHTSKGDIRVKLAGKDAPIHVGNFVELAQKGYYTGIKFHRHEPGFVIQGGCPNTRELSPDEVKAGRPGPGGPAGTGGPGYTIKGEWQTNPNNQHKDGTLAMARTSAPDTAGSQFYFCLGPQSFLDANYTVFGDPIDDESLTVIHNLEKGDEITGVDIENAS
ncbi:MAG: peptidylprolyl isomerase [Coriobacteriales bacterium]|jgi:peptidyl-prolyl cis-trans isomerase B (cyclophilin B)|nr:peptidylprolyl isomerase [Coriobacteriales bacterium]